MNSLAERIARLSPAQRARLEARLLETAALAPSIPPRDPHAPIPVASPQARLWLIQQLDPQMILFNAPGGWHLRGALDVAALQFALDTIVARHAALRTGIHVVNGEPAQIIHPPARVELVTHDLQNIPPAQHAQATQNIVRAMVERPFDLARDILLRAAVIQLAQQEFFFCTARHHIANDAWSVVIFNRELVECYRAFVANETPQLPALSAEYADFAHWQNERLNGAWFERELAYWRAQLHDVPNLELATDRPRPPRLTYRGAQLSFPLDSALVASLRETCLRENVTLFMFMLAAFEILLARYAGQNDFAVGTNILGRDRPEYENLIGYFANVLALRARLDASFTVREFLQRTRQVTLDAFSHRELPFEKIIWDLRRTRDESRAPLFQVLFQTTQLEFHLNGLPGLEATPFFFDPHTSEYDISLDVRDMAARMECAFRYSADLFDAATITRMAQHYTNILREMIARPDTRIAELPILDASTRAQILVTWNDTRAEFPNAACIHELVAQQAARAPNAIAAQFENETLTYRELNARANQLAHHLIARGIAPEMRVGICIERSLEMVVALLGVLKAGAAYLPLEPNAPPARLQFILERANAALLITSASIAHSLALEIPRVTLPQDWNLLSQERDENPQGNVCASNLAYVIYTSGTTGQPKGVMIEHHALVNHATFFARDYDITARDRVLQFAPIAFDFSAEEIFPAWLGGATIVIRPEHAALTPREFFEFVARHQLTMLDLPTAFWHTLIQAMEETSLALPPCVRLVIVGGEQVDAQLFQKWRARVGTRARWVNTYGPTEATIAVTTFELATDARADLSLTIGRPIANTQMYILDARMQPVPIGVDGDLHIGGEPIARGYLDAPELTAEKFVPNPFTASAAARLYKTGDRARYRADGQIEFRGRRDTQVKLRGFRIELSEIETTLAQHPDIQANVVVLREDEPNAKRLVAYLVARRPAPAPIDLRMWLRARLPEYMLPSAFVFLDALPLTANGKVNRRALPAPESITHELDAEFIAPRTPAEERVAEIWREVLRVPRVGAADNFFDLGGHSLLATLAVARAETAFAQSIPLRSLFENPTVQEWARALEQNGASAAAAPPLVRVERERYRRAPA